jgi:hypothetical protein
VSDVGFCTCAAQCPDYKHCACILIVEDPEEGKEGHCRCSCRDTPGASAPLARKATLDSRVALDVRGATVGTVARLVASLTDAEILVPALAIDRELQLYMEETTLGSALREVGLIVRELPEPDPTS